MKTLLIILIMLVSVPAFSKTKNLPFAPKAKSIYKKHKTKKCKAKRPKVFDYKKCWR